MRIALPSLLIGSLLMLASCAAPSSTPLKPGAKARLAGHSLAVVRQKFSPLRVITPAQALVGSVAVTAGYAAAPEALATAGGRGASGLSADPGEPLEAGLVAHFTQRLGMKPGVRQTIPPRAPDARNRPTYPSTGADYVLEIGPVIGTAVYFPTAWLRYRVGGSAKVRLVDSHTGEVLAEGAAGAMPTERSDGLSHDEVMENTGGKVSRQLNEAMRRALVKFTTETFAP